MSVDTPPCGLLEFSTQVPSTGVSVTRWDSGVGLDRAKSTVMTVTANPYT